MIFSSQKARRKKLFHALSSGQHLWWLHSHSVLQGREVVERCPSPWSWSSELCEGGKARAPVTRSPAESKTMKAFVCNLFHTTTTKISLVQSEFRWFCMLTIYISCKGGVNEKLKLYQSVYQSWPNISADHPCSMQILTCLCTLFHQQSSQRHRNFFLSSPMPFCPEEVGFNKWAGNRILLNSRIQMIPLWRVLHFYVEPSEVRI